MEVFNIRDVISDQAQKESTITWARTNQEVKIPVYQKIPRIGKSPGMYNFINNIFRELLP